MRALPWVLALLFGWYTLYSPLTLYLPTWYPDLWPTTGGGILMGTLIIGIAFRVATAFFPHGGGDVTLDLAGPSTKTEPRQTRHRPSLLSHSEH